MSNLEFVLELADKFEFFIFDKKSLNLAAASTRAAPIMSRQTLIIPRERVTLPLECFGLAKGQETDQQKQHLGSTVYFVDLSK